MLPGVRARFAPLVLIAVIALAACDGGGSGGDPSSPAGPSSTVGSPSGSAPPVTVSHSGPPQPTRPTVPADVPTTGPNLRKPGERPPVMPLEATQHTQDGAVAFAKFFELTIDWGYATTSTAYMKHYFESTCVTCVSVQKGLDDAAAKGNHFLGGRMSITRATVQANDGRPGAEQSVLVVYRLASIVVLSKNGTFVTGDPALTMKDQVYLRWSSDRWVVVEMVPTP
jgi:hypothetical protein